MTYPARFLSLLLLCGVVQSCDSPTEPGSNRVAVVLVSPAAQALSSGDSLTLTATTVSAKGEPLIGRVVEWKSSDTTLATVLFGYVVGRTTNAPTPRPVTITATSEGIAGHTILLITRKRMSEARSAVSLSLDTITASAATSTITVTARDAKGDPLTGRTVVLKATGAGNSLTQPAAVTDTAGVTTGTITSTVAGTKTVSATIDGAAVAQTVTITVTPAAPAEDATARIMVAMSLVKVRVGENVAVAIDAYRGSTRIPFEIATNNTCATVTQESARIVVSGIYFECYQDVTVTAANAPSRTIRLHVYDPKIMDIGEGLMIRFVNTYRQIYEAGDADVSANGRAYAPDRSVLPATQRGWYALGSLMAYQDRVFTEAVKPARSFPMVVVTDYSVAGDLLAAPLDYELYYAARSLWVWTPICPSGYKSFGPVLYASPSKPSSEETRCVAARFMVQGTVGNETYVNGLPGASAMKTKLVGPESPFAPPHEGRVSIPVGTVIVCKTDSVYNALCVDSLFQRLLIPVEPFETANDEMAEPLLTGHHPLIEAGAHFFSSVRVPFVLLPAENPDCATSGCTNDQNLRFEYNVNESPFYTVERVETYQNLGFLYNSSGSATQEIGKMTVTTGFESTSENSFTEEIGWGVTAKVGSDDGPGSLSASYSHSLSWSRSYSETFSSTVAREFGPYYVPPGHSGQALQIETSFRRRTASGLVVGTSISALQNSVIYLEYPRSP